MNARVDEAWDWLVDNAGVHEQTLQVATGINGYTMSTIDDVCYVIAGMDFEQLHEENNG